jgi:hypothetical protein
MTVQIDICNANAVRTWLDERIKANQFKPCGHLLLKGLTHRMRGPAVTSTSVMFLPQCQRRSLLWKGQPTPDLELERELLSMGQLDLISCPEYCKFYQHKLVSRLFGFVPASWRWLKAELNPAFEWYSKLSGGTQMLIILLLILLFAPRWVPKMIELAKAIAGK